MQNNILEKDKRLIVSDLGQVISTETDDLEGKAPNVSPKH